MTLIAALECLLKARQELTFADIDELNELDKAINNLCKVLGLSRKHLEEGCY